MIKLITYCFDKWWRPVLFSGLTSSLLVLSEFVGGGTYNNVSFILLELSVIGLVISFIYQMVKKRWLKSIFTLLILGAIIAFIYLGTLFLVFCGSPCDDRFADNLKIPDNIQMDDPIDPASRNMQSDSMQLLSKSQMSFQLYNSFQPGLYEYDFWVGKIERGTIYLKAFEITNEYELSTNELPTKSSVNVFNTTDSIRRFGTTSDFTIYEGDFGKPYAARFEIWFKPATGRAERKLLAKNYRIEGWQR